ncbi:hypothetical protein AtNW77_Chr2g0229711 [Arabidopsis thaliana]|uniref:Transmembrane protein n=3 Tax=Arabidopsis TaxID=3701 RepID=B3H430_ARATH|nr:uncharacterized protein AT2G11778 [Arabidopsis thaliana]AEC06182.1 transmembrane protein [Arabidopsis thaliana]KAG7636088.1 hypothetical protein ISN45_At02g006840 [Arabidopsis thaliana x Arabidopsis arenosa]VYS52260.1 unnamed protein product [Arabidopsis thaliana]|eukprot:NP_001118300.1 transmembrane protein [Arabidopsis thaliana]
MPRRLHCVCVGQVLNYFGNGYDCKVIGGCMQVIIVSFLVVDVRFGYTLVITLCSR